MKKCKLETILCEKLKLGETNVMLKNRSQNSDLNEFTSVSKLLRFNNLKLQCKIDEKFKDSKILFARQIHQNNKLVGRPKKINSAS